MTPLEKLIKETEDELQALLPTIVERTKKRIHLAYLYGVTEAREIYPEFPDTAEHTTSSED